MTVEAARLVVCEGCGAAFELSARNVRANRQAGKPLRCRRCRGTSETRTATEADKRWWLERFTLDEIRQLAEAIWD